VVADFVRQRGIDCGTPAPLAQFDCYEDAYYPSWVAAAGRLFTVRASISVSYAVGFSEPGE